MRNRNKDLKISQKDSEKSYSSDFQEMLSSRQLNYSKLNHMRALIKDNFFVFYNTDKELTYFTIEK